MDIKALLAGLKGLSLKDANSLLVAVLKEARDTCDLVDTAKRDFTPEERTAVADLLAGAKQIKGRITELKGDEEMRTALITLGEGAGVTEGGQGKAKRQSLGSLFTTSEAWKAWLKGNMNGDHIPDNRKGLHSPPIDVKSFGILGQKDVMTGTADDQGGAFVNTDLTGIYEPLGRYPLNIRQLIDVRTTGSDTVEFVRQLTQSNAAAPVPESNVTEFTGYPGQVSGLKPESSMTYERVQETVKTIAVWVPATKRALSDAAQLRGLIDQELREDLAEELENQVLNGNGSGENFTGLAQTANVLVQPFIQDILVTTRKAITNLLINGKQVPSAWLLNPIDWEGIELLKDSTGQFRWGGPINRGPAQLWGVPVVQSFFQPQGSGWLANFRKAVLWDREQANISVSDSHADFFIRNMVAILAEMRAAFGVIRPSAFCQVDLNGS